MICGAIHVTDVAISKKFAHYKTALERWDLTVTYKTTQRVPLVLFCNAVESLSITRALGWIHRVSLGGAHCATLWQILGSLDTRCNNSIQYLTILFRHTGTEVRKEALIINSRLLRHDVEYLVTASGYTVQRSVAFVQGQLAPLWQHQVYVLHWAQQFCAVCSGQLPPWFELTEEMRFRKTFQCISSKKKQENTTKMNG